MSIYHRLWRVAATCAAAALVPLATAVPAHAAFTAQGVLWGNNYFGQLGDGTVAIRHTPGPLLDPAGWRAVDDGFTAALRDGGLWTWGNNDVSQLGDGTFADQLYPTRIGGSQWSAVAAGSSDVDAIAANSALWSWGFNRYSQVGDGTAINRPSPVQIDAVGRWTSVSAGSYFAIALRL